MRQSLALFGLSVLMTLGGCATLSESQCVASDWQTVGHRDGMNGTQHSQQLLKHQNACVKHGVTPDRTAYMNGWNDGVVQYCQPDNGFAAGERGAGYANVCPDYMAEAFNAAYQDGRQLHLAQAEISNEQRTIHQKQQRLDRVEKEISATEALVIEGDLTSLERREMLDETKELAKEQGQLETEVQALKIDVAVKTERLANLRQELVYASY
jgi:hypothetical protein